MKKKIKNVFVTNIIHRMVLNVYLLQNFNVINIISPSSPH